MRALEIKSSKHALCTGLVSYQEDSVERNVGNQIVSDIAIPSRSRDPYSGKSSIPDVVELVNDRSPCSAAVSGKRSIVSSQ